MAVLPPAPQRTVALTTGLHQRETSVGSPSYSTAWTSPTSNGPCSNRSSARAVARTGAAGRGPIRGYDSDGLDDLLMTQYGIEMIAANRRGRAKTQDSRPLRRAKRRWKIERLFAWLHNCRRVVTRWERHVGNYLGMVQLACARILLWAFMR
jgi:transposase